MYTKIVKILSIVSFISSTIFTTFLRTLRGNRHSQKIAFWRLTLSVHIQPSGSASISYSGTNNFGSLEIRADAVGMVHVMKIVQFPVQKVYSRTFWKKIKINSLYDVTD
ncbi:hypothetical protein GWI33_019557 [Rhynchophorus ferrugineus]|uniref:Uncharacterized protein n=1 Tax=Rhynchophorus ferrugineus TaxID=354439 RepID=A0A834HRF6_RHYFE|nr:hypothetical protein GWI33_019557 [Rhynchophorus ferrugineus]